MLLLHGEELRDLSPELLIDDFGSLTPSNIPFVVPLSSIEEVDSTDMLISPFQIQLSDDKLHIQAIVPFLFPLFHYYIYHSDLLPNFFQLITFSRTLPNTNIMSTVQDQRISLTSQV